MNHFGSKILPICARLSFRSLKHRSCLALLALLALAVTPQAARAGKIYVPNPSFESPAVPDVAPFAIPYSDYWQETAQPGYYDPTNFNNTPWQYLVGQFYNDPGDGAYIDNCDGNQCGFLQSLPLVGIFQDYNSFSDTQGGPTHAFNATYKPGHAYYLNFGLIGGGGGMPSNATLQVSFYYRDASSNMVTVATRTITNTIAVFPTNTHFVDFQVDVPTVQTNDPWANQNIGIQFLCTVDFTTYGGYWDVDNVRLTEGLNVPNFSFESPAVPDQPPFAQPGLGNWQETSQPGYYDPTNFNNTPWFYLAGGFYNDPGDGAYIDNCDSNQCAFLQSLPLVGIYQDFSVSPAFNATFNPGKGYNLTTGVIGGGGGMPANATLLMSLYYLDASNNMVTVAATTITNTPTLFPTNTHFVDCQLVMPPVKATDPWAGKHIGIEYLCTVDFTTYGGYWDVDNVRLSETVGPAMSNPAPAGGQFTFNVLGEPGTVFNVLSSPNTATPGTNWISLGTVTNVSGTTPFTDTATNLPQRFYRLKQL